MLEMNTDTEQLMKKLHASLCPNKLEAEIRDKFMALEAEIDRYLRNNLDDYCLEPLCGTLYESWVTP